eukprot:jgi/Mesen1/3069/ME000180S02296
MSCQVESARWAATRWHDQFLKGRKERAYFGRLLAQCLAGRDQSLGLPLEEGFCRALLSPQVQEEGADRQGHAEEHFDPSEGVTGGALIPNHVELGVPRHPLYIALAVSLHRWIATCHFPVDMPPMPGLSEDDSWRARVPEWTAQVARLGSELLRVCGSGGGRGGVGAALEMHVQEPFFSSLQGGHAGAGPPGVRLFGAAPALPMQGRIWPSLGGEKTIEGRCNVGAYCRLQPGDLLLVNSSLHLLVQRVHPYASFGDMLVAEGVASVLPGVTSVEEGVAVYRRFYSEEKEACGGVVAIHVSRPPADRSAPPALLMRRLLQAALGMRTTAGSRADTLPPPRSALLRSFQALHDSKSKLTAGARALSKHAHRCSSGWWGTMTGTEAAKNETALRTVTRVLDRAVWLNVHCLPHDLPIFEARVAGGYGARWSANGSQFRGFLEPPMAKGHERRWRH